MFERVAVVGAGLIGGSIARRLQALQLMVTVVDPDATTIGAAAGLGLAVADAVPADADLIVLAVPLDRVAEALEQVAPAAPQAVVIDVGSVKQAPADAAEAAGLGERYVGCHPMAGTEHTGFEHSDERLLLGATWAVTHSGGIAETVRVVEWLAEHFEATVVVLEAEEHDRNVALVSHSPHAVAHALLAIVERAPAPSVAGLLAAGSFRDGTRVAGRNAVRTFNMLAENAAALGPVLDDLVAELTALRAELDVPDALRARLEGVAAADGLVRHPDPDFTTCSSLSETIATARADGAAIVVRRRAGSLEFAPTPYYPAGASSV
ncbi:prephenate dehydrogenase/arogenate dehydrogenase family protein [soil metagenome]